ncbi:MAG: beta-lactamase family protein [Parvularculaceae bacterium]|nr:beta-lactamase family protein [Parvularculaceae bacterium]
MTKRVGLLVSGIVAVFCNFLASAAFGEITEDQAATIRAYIDGLVEEGEPGIAVGVVTGGEVTFEHYVGLANLDIPSPIGPKSRFNVASNAKQYTALMVLELAEEGKVDLSKDFRTFLPGAMPEVDETITVAQLITHTSGVREISELWGLTGVTWYERPFDSGDAMDMLNGQNALNFRPGTKFLYSNSNYILLAELVEAVTETRFHRYAKAFFEARKMPSTYWRRRYGEVVPNMARPYMQWSGWLENPTIANTYGDGFLYTTLRDQMAWEKQIWGHNTTLPSGLIAKSQLPVEDQHTSTYGYGIEIGNFNGLPSVWHVGSTGGANAYTLRLTDQQTSIVVMGNTGQVSVVGVGQRVAETLFADDFVEGASNFPARPETIGKPINPQDYLGLYQLNSGTIMRIVLRDGELFREIEGADPVRLLPEEGNIYLYETIDDLRIAFFVGDDGRPTFGIYAPYQGTQTATLLDPTPENERDKKRLEGTFVNAETGTEIVLRHVEGNEFKWIKNGRERDAKLIGKNYLTSNSYRIRVQRRGSRSATGLLVDNDRIRNVVFDRVD